MKIDDIKINAFGKLSDKNIKLSNGINVIYGENESGKSTLLQYITDIFYNISRTKDGKDITDYDRFKPWDKEEFGGKLSYELDNGKRFEIYRNFNKKNDLKLYNEDMEDVSGLYEADKKTGSNFFLEQTKLDKSAFCSSVVSRQQGVKLDSGSQKEIIQKITNLVSTGDDNISYTKVVKALEDKIKKEIGTKQSSIQPINVLEREIQNLEEEKSNLEEYKVKKYEIEDIKKNVEGQKENYKKFYNFMSDVKKIKDEGKIKKAQFDIIENEIVKNETRLKELQAKRDELGSQITQEKSDVAKLQLLYNFAIEIKQVKDEENVKNQSNDVIESAIKAIDEKISSLNESRKAIEEEIVDRKEELHSGKSGNKSINLISIVGIILGLVLIVAGVLVNKIISVVGVLVFVISLILKIVTFSKNNFKKLEEEIDNDYKDSFVRIDTQLEMYQKEKEDNLSKLHSSDSNVDFKQAYSSISSKYEGKVEETEINVVLNSNNVNSLVESYKNHLDELILNNRSNEKEFQNVVNALSELPVALEKSKQNKLSIINEANNMKIALIDKYKNELDVEKINNIFAQPNVDEMYDKAKKQYEEIQLAEKKLSFDEENIIPNLEKLASNIEKIENLNEKRNEMIRYRESIELAVETLQHAYIKMKNNVTPHFSNVLSENISHITDGKYKNVRINEKDVLTVEMENGTYDSAEILSVGTIEQIYLALRIAIISEISEENMPIILDEAFAYYDQERLKNILLYINKEFSDKQVIIFTCSHREKEILDKYNVEYNEVLLETL